jgi:hypothetical protein
MAKKSFESIPWEKINALATSSQRESFLSKWLQDLAGQGKTFDIVDVFKHLSSGGQNLLNVLAKPQVNKFYSFSFKVLNPVGPFDGKFAFRNGVKDTYVKFGREVAITTEKMNEMSEIFLETNNIFDDCYNWVMLPIVNDTITCDYQTACDIVIKYTKALDKYKAVCVEQV